MGRGSYYLYFLLGDVCGRICVLNLYIRVFWGDFLDETLSVKTNVKAQHSCPWFLSSQVDGFSLTGKNLISVIPLLQ